MSYEEISLNGFIREMHGISIGDYARKFCFVLGAGASISSGIKSGQELINIWEKDLLERNKESYESWKEELGITKENKYSFYSHYYEKRFKRKSTDGYNYLVKLMEKAKPSVGYVMLAYLLAETSHNVVITTNFDHLIEDAVNYYVENIPLVIGHESLSSYITKTLTRPTIIKIHRDLLFDPANNVEDVSKLHSSWEHALDNVFSEYHPIFIGYAGNDNSLMDYLNKNSQKFANEEWCFPYWMLYKNDSLDGMILDFLEKSKGYYIRHEGFDEVLSQMGAKFDCRVPSEEDFINDAKKRYKDLTDALDELTDRIARKNKGDAEAESETEETELTRAVQQITDQAELQKMYHNATQCFHSGKFEEALKLTKPLVEIDSENARYRNSLGVILHELKRYDEALKEKEMATKLEPKNARYQDNLGITLHELKRYDEALKEKEKAVELEPENARYRDSLGITLHELKHYDEALKESQKAVELEPENARYRNGLGVTLHKLKRYDEALVEKKKAVELEPKNARYRDSLGFTLNELKHKDK